MIKRILPIGVSFVILFLVLFSWFRQYSTRLVVRSFVLMDTRVDIALLKRDSGFYPRLFSYARSLSDRLNAFDNNSCVYRLNNKGIISRSDDVCYGLLKDLISISNRVRLDTNGSFDPGYRKGVSVAKIVLDEDGIHIPSDSYYDFSGIAKGFIVDKLIEKAKLDGVGFIMVNAGGDIGVYDAKGIGVLVGIKNPYGMRDFGKVWISKGAIATSGNYERGRHIYNPESGRPVETSLVSASVVSDSCAIADGWATASFVLGRKVLLLANKKNIAVILVNKIRDKIFCEGNLIWKNKVKWKKGNC